MIISKAKILCVDDDPNLLLLNSSILQLADYQVLEASTGNECLSIVKKERPDLVLLDVMLPDISGFDVCKQIKSDPELSGTYVILISGMETSSESRVKGLEAGGDGYIVRPVSSQELLARVQAMIRIKQSETALRKSMQRYQMLVETMNEGMGVLDEKELITFVNKRLCEMIGYQRDEIIGHHVTDFLDDVNQKIFKERLLIEREKGISTSYELCLMRRDGQKVYTIISPKPIIDNDGNFKGGFAVITDITERKLMEKALERTLSQTKLILNSVGEGIYGVDINGNAIFVNPALLRMTGYEAEELIGKNLHFILHHSEPDRSSYHRDNCTGLNTLKSGIAFSNVTGKVIWKKDDTSFHVEYTCAPLLEQDMVIGAVAVIRDISKRKKAEEEIKRLNQDLERRVIERTKQLQVVIEELENEVIERKKTEEALKKSEEQFRAIFNTAQDSIFIKDCSLRYLRVNPSMERLFNLSASQLLAKTDEELFGEEAGKHIGEVDSRVLNGEIIEEEHTKPVKDDFRTFHVIKVPMRDMNGKIIGICGIARDITERKLDEATLLQYAKQLKTLSNRLIEVQEAERRYIAQELHDEIGQALTGIKLALDMLIKSPPVNIEAHLIEVQKMVQELLSKVRNIALDLRPSMLDDLGLLPALLWHFERFTNQTNVQVKFRHDGLNARFRPEIETAAYRIVQEALTNVARYACVNEVTVLITINQDTLIINIEDKGVGFDYEAVKVTGNSAGLKWMHERLTMLGGQMIIESNPGTGTRLTASIPLKTLSLNCNEER